MIETLFILGESGTGKSTSMRNLPPAETLIISPNAKNLPWPGGTAKFKADGGTLVQIDSFQQLEKFLKLALNIGDHTNKQDAPYRNIVMEDFSHLFASHIMSDRFRSRNTKAEAFQRYSDMAKEVYDAVFKTVEIAKRKLPEDCDTKIVLINHTDVDDQGMAGFKSAGKLFKQEIKPESHVTVVLHAITVEADKVSDRYRFQTQKTYDKLAKSPMGLFKDELIPNDLNHVLTRMREYDEGIIEE